MKRESDGDEAASQLICGGCHCGEIRYQAVSPVYQLTHCHCSICRAFGGTLMSWIAVDQSGFEITRGQTRIYKSSQKAQREFCETCGTHLTFKRLANSKRMDIALTTLDQPADFAPDNQIWGMDRLALLADINDLPISPEDGDKS